MGRMRQELVKAPTPNTLVASAQRYTGSEDIKHDFARSTAQDNWHEKGWAFYRSVGEYRYACDWVGSMLSKALLRATVEKNGKIEIVQHGKKANEYVERLFGESDGKAEMLRLIGIHFTVTGECWIVGYQHMKDGIEQDHWEVAASTRVRNVGTPDNPVWRINDKVPEDVDPADILLVRMWRPDPLEPQKSISPTLAVLPILEEIHRLTQHIAAQIDSRLAGAGILLMPTEMTLPPEPDAEAEDGQTIIRANTAESLMKIIQKTMAKSINERGKASQLVPIVITAPAEVIDKIQHVTFWSDLDEKAIEMRNEAIRRLALGMDIPPEVLQGNADSNHWSSWQSDESAIKAHAEPLLKIITSGLAEGYLRPLLADEGVEDGLELGHYSIKADTSEMRLRPNRSKEALELYNLGELNGEALRRETGFDPDDAMTDEQQKLWVLRKMAQGSTTPEQVAAAFRILFKEELGAGEASGEEGREERPAPSLKDHPVQDIPDRERSVRRKEARERGDVPSAAALIAASEMAVVRALERAGNRLKGKLNVRTTVPAVKLYMSVLPVDIGMHDFLLDDAWSHLSAVAKRNGVSEAWLKTTLDHYCRSLFTNQVEHSYEDFDDYMHTQLRHLREEAS